MSLNLVHGVPSATPPTDDGTLDVHAHAMPLPLLQRLADRDLADLAEVPSGIVRLDPRVSGVGPRAPLPLARSMYDVDVRLSEMDEVGVHRHAPHNIDAHRHSRVGAIHARPLCAEGRRAAPSSHWPERRRIAMGAAVQACESPSGAARRSHELVSDAPLRLRLGAGR